jgi:hypothetical protein
MTEMTKTYLTSKNSDLRVISQFTDASQTVRLKDGRYGFCDGLGGVYARVVVRISGYAYIYGTATASADHTNAYDALRAESVTFPQGATVEYRDRLSA